VHLENLPTPYPLSTAPSILEKFEQILVIKSRIYQDLEGRRNQKTIKSFLDVAIHLSLTPDLQSDEWESILVVSQVHCSPASQFQLGIEMASGDKCLRCWKIQPLTGDLCERCFSAVKKEK